MSRATLAEPMISPVADLTGEMLSDTSSKPSVLGGANGVEMLDILAAADTFQDVMEVAPPLRRNDDID
jgi:hypothetical protein